MYYSRCRPSGLHEVHYFFNVDAEFILTSLTRRRRKALLNPVTDSSQSSPHTPVGPKKDYSLKEGQTFSISIPGHSKPSAENTFLGSSSLGSTASSSSTIPLLPPPPGAPRKRWPRSSKIYVQNGHCKHDISRHLVEERFSYKIGWKRMLELWSMLSCYSRLWFVHLFRACKYKWKKPT